MDMPGVAQNIVMNPEDPDLVEMTSVDLHAASFDAFALGRSFAGEPSIAG